jgi:release factor glutamine methyltransferase
MTAWSLYESLRGVLEQNGIVSAQLEAWELAAKAVNLDRRNAAVWKQTEVTAEQKADAEALLAQRLQGKPIAYLIGEWDFYGYTFRVTSDVLIPRSDTECLCDAAVREAKRYVRPRVLDLCCGSGCIGIALAKTVPQASVVGVDISEQALCIARENAARHGLDSTHYTAQWGDARCMERLPGQYDILVCNPPYITAEEMRQLDPGVSEFEPHLALYGGEDGLDFYRILAERSAEKLTGGGCLLVECGWKQAADVAELFRHGDLIDVEMQKDLTGIPRIVCARTPSDSSKIKEQ